MKDDFIPSLGRVLVYEGGKVDDPEDAGGRTNEGVTQTTYNAWRSVQGLPAANVYNILSEEVAAIYQTEYWNRVGGDKLPVGIDFIMFDAAVNSGVSMAIKWAQAALDTGLRIDGVLGSRTLDALANLNDVDAFIEDYCARRLASLQRLKNYAHFGNGWHARIANVQKIGVEWADAGHAAGVGTQVAEVMTVNGHRKARVTDIPVNRGSALIAHATAAASATTTVATQASTSLAGAVDTIPKLKYVLAGLTVVAAISGVVLTVAANAKQAAKDALKSSPVNLDADDNVPFTTINETIAAAGVTATPAQAVDALRTQLRS